MRLVDQPATLQWHEFPMVSERHQKIDPVQRRKVFETATAAARYAIESLPETVHKLATITVVDTPPQLGAHFSMRQRPHARLNGKRPDARRFPDDTRRA